MHCNHTFLLIVSLLAPSHAIAPPDDVICVTIFRLLNYVSALILEVNKNGVYDLFARELSQYLRGLYITVSLLFT